MNLRSPRAVLAFAMLGLLTSGCASAPAGPARAPREPFDVQGHRGARGLLPENTLEAFEAALEMGVSTLELDLGVTADGAVVVTHDRWISAHVCLEADGSRLRAEPLVRDLTLAQVRGYDCGSLNPSRARFPEPPRRNIPGARIPTLAEVFALTDRLGDSAVRFNVETKIHPERDDTVPAEDFVRAVVEVVRAHGMEERVTLQSFDWRTLALVKKIAPRIETAALLEEHTVEGNPSPWLNGLSFEAEGATALGLLRAASDYVDLYSPDWHGVLPGHGGFLGSTVEEVQAAGFPVVPWTVNDAADIERVLDLGVDGLITDYPDRLLEILRARGVAVR